jgi:hypothetical protein
LELHSIGHRRPGFTQIKVDSALINVGLPSGPDGNTVDLETELLNWPNRWLFGNARS